MKHNCLGDLWTGQEKEGNIQFKKSVEFSVVEDAKVKITERQFHIRFCIISLFNYSDLFFHIINVLPSDGISHFMLI